MISLGHTQPTLEYIQSHCDFFCTITLPKCHYKYSCIKQADKMNIHVKRIAENYFHEAYGTYELTQKGNVHCHLLVRLRPEMLIGETKYIVAHLSGLLKRYGNCDFQYVKHHDKCYEYVYKDIAMTKIMLGGKMAIVSLVRKSDYINPLSEILEEVTDSLDYTSNMDSDIESNKE